MEVSEEDRILRLWTPVILRAALLASTLILVSGLVIIGLLAPGAYVARFHQIQAGGATYARERWSELATEALKGQPRPILMIGLMVLTLVPLGRVAFTFFFFLREKDGPFIVLTATVLGLLILGVVLGRVG